MPENPFPESFDLGDPDIQFHDLAKAMGVDSARIETREEIGPALDRGARRRPPVPDRPRRPQRRPQRRGAGQAPDGRPVMTERRGEPRLTETVTPGRVFYDRHIQFLVDKDVDGLVETNYAPDAELVTFQNGHQRARGAAQPTSTVTSRCSATSSSNRPTSSPRPTTRSSSRRPSGRSSGRARVYDAWVLRDGQITHHFTGVMGT